MKARRFTLSTFDDGACYDVQTDTHKYMGTVREETPTGSVIVLDVFNVSALIDNGHMAFTSDVDGLKTYLEGMRIIRKADRLVMA